MSDNDQGEYTIWSVFAPFRKDGSPVLGSFGASVKGVILIDVETWKRMCADNPQLAATKFRVGTTR
jgi:hypothetical protein